MIGRWSLLVLLAGHPLLAQEAATVRNPNVTISLVAAPTAPSGGSSRTVAMVFRLAPGWHIYWRNPGTSGIATSIAWRLPSGMRTDSLAWPVPEFYDVSGIVTHVMHDEVALLTTVSLPAGRGGRVEARVTYGICKEVCVPGAATVQLDLDRPVSIPRWREAERIATARRPRGAGAPQVAAVAATGGVALMVRATAGTTLPDTLTFYASDRDHLPAAVRVPVRRGQQEVRLTLPMAERPDRLQGVLVGGSPSRRDPVGWAVSVPVRPETPRGR